MLRKQEALAWLREASGGKAHHFHEGQWEAIQALVQDRSRVLLVQRTGWGKSMVYFLATRLLRGEGAGPTLIISPLLSLMRNQRDAAQRLGLVAHTINTSNRAEWDEIMQGVRDNRVDLLLVSPERLSNDDFIQRCLLPVAGRIALFVVDEAHCISDWGHDFRPDYQRIHRILKALPPNVAVLATTATANDRVVADVMAQLGPAAIVQRGTLARRSLKLQNIALPHRAARLAWLAENIPRLPGSGIIYTLTVRDAERVAAWLKAQGISAIAYHGQLDSDMEDGGSAEAREDLEARLLENDVKALVATNALGMGFDKPDLGFVIHFQAPQSVVHYYQQVGRAGRAIAEAFGVLLGGQEDDDINRYFIEQAFPPEEQIREILAALEDAEEGLTASELMRTVNLRKGQLEKALKILATADAAPVIRSEGRWVRTANAYAMDRPRIQRLTRHRDAEWKQMQDYMRSTSCLMEFLEKALDDPAAQPCGHCAVCLGHPLLPVGSSAPTMGAAIAFERRSEVVIQPRKRWEKDAFPRYGFRGNIPPTRQNEAGRALSSWGDMGWPQLVREGKEAAHFHDDLVAACAELVRNRWRPAPPPTWVTCVPSLRSPGLVPDFAERLATRLGLSFVAAVSKVEETSRQRQMMSSWKQAHNLDGAFTVEHDRVLPGAVLLVDDIVDSRWSMTVIGAMLRDAGAAAVHPLALSLAGATSG